MDDYDSYDQMPTGDDFWSGSWDTGSPWNPTVGWDENQMQDLGDGYFLNSDGQVVLPDGSVYNESGDVWSGKGDGSTGRYSTVPNGSGGAGGALSAAGQFLKGLGLDSKTLGTLLGLYQVSQTNRNANKTNQWQQGQIPGGFNAQLQTVAPGGALGQMTAAKPQPWQSKIGYAEGGPVRPGMDNPSIMGFLQYLYNNKMLPSEVAEEKRRKKEGDLLQRGAQEVSSPTNALDRRMKAMDLKGGGPLSLVRGPGAGQDDKIPAQLSDGEYVFDADTVSALGDGSTDAGAAKLDKMRERLRAHKRKASPKKIPPKAKDPMKYLGG